jgi:CheY-like chemotaxis protein
MKYQIHPFYFPTMCLFIDDSISFLENLSLQLNKNLAFKLYCSPFDALIDVNMQGEITSETRKYFSKYKNMDELTYSSHVLNLDLEKIHRCVYDDQRFETLSVVVVDFAMPEMDGIEFCRNIKNTSIRKILLTGKADEKLAVRAFNEGVIDRFIMKNDKDVLINLNESIHELQHDYFHKSSAALAHALSYGTHRFLLDPFFSEVFIKICTELNIIEYYLYSNPDGLLMLDAKGNATLIIVYTEKELREQYEIAYDQAAPQELLNRLKTGKSIPYFWKTNGHYSPKCENWSAYLHEANEFQGNEWYYYALIKNPAPYKAGAVLSYNEYLNLLDQNSKHSPQVQ